MGPDQDTEQEVPETGEQEQEHRQTAVERSHANEVPASFDHGKYDEGGDYAIAELMALHGWCSSKSLSPFHFERLKQTSRIPSPFACYGSDYESQVSGLMTGTVRSLWEHVRSQDKPADTQGSSDGTWVCCCCYNDIKKAPKQSLYHSFAPAEDRLYIKGHPSTEFFSMRRAVETTIPDIAEQGFFVINKSREQIFINGQVMKTGAIVGPLTDFAVIEKNETVIFWWRNKQALEYIPGDDSRDLPWWWGMVNSDLVESMQQYLQGKKGVKRPQETQGSRGSKRPKTGSQVQSNNGTNPSTTSGEVLPTNVDDVTSQSNTATAATLLAPAPENGRNGATTKTTLTTDPSQKKPQNGPRTVAPGGKPTRPKSQSKGWKNFLDAGLARHRGSRQQIEARETGTFTTLEALSALDQNQVVISIATIWQGLRQHGQLFAFADPDFFGYDPPILDLAKRLVGAPEKFIMPILWHDQPGKEIQAGKETYLGHFVLFVAEWCPEPGEVRLELFNSSTSGPSTQQLVTRAKELIMGSHWPDSQAQKAEPSFFSYVRSVACPIQEGVNTCGFSVILNAWCVMLGIPISPTDKRRELKGSHKIFLKTGLEIVNLALKGCMDAHTIQAFVNYWGYSQDQKYPEDLLANNVAAVRMDGELLNTALYEQAMIESAIEDGVNALIESLISMRLWAPLTFGYMRKLVIDANGDHNIAIEVIISQFGKGSDERMVKPVEQTDEIDERIRREVGGFLGNFNNTQ